MFGPNLLQSISSLLFAMHRRRGVKCRHSNQKKILTVDGKKVYSFGHFNMILKIISTLSDRGLLSMEIDFFHNSILHTCNWNYVVDLPPLYVSSSLLKVMKYFVKIRAFKILLQVTALC